MSDEIRFNINSMKNSARANQLAYNLLRTVTMNGMDKDMSIAMLFMPQITLCALACELFLKIKLVQEKGKLFKGHSLDYLFHKLNQNSQKITSESVKESIQQITNMQDFDFETLLKKNSYAFEKTRYFYEGSLSVDVLFMDKLLDVLSMSV